MVRSAHDALFARLLGESSAFGSLHVDSNRAPGQIVAATTAAAGNLIGKALRARMHGDGDRAAALLERAVRLPYDDHEGWWPALHAVSMALFNVIIDDLEAAGQDDQQWLDRALAVHARSAGIGRQELAHLLEVVAQDYQLTHGEQRRLRAVRREVDGSSDGLVLSWGPDASLDDIRRVTVDVLDVVVDYAGAVSSSGQD